MLVTDSVTGKAADAAATAADAITSTTEKAADKATGGADKAAASVEKTADKAATATGKAADKAAAGAKKAAASVEKTADKTVAAATGDDAKPAAKPAPQRSLDEIETDLDATRERLAQGLDDLQEYVSPKNIAARQVDKVKGVFIDQYGGVKPERVAMAVGALVAVVVIARLISGRGGSGIDED